MINCKKEEIMKKILNFSLILFVFCLTSFMSIFFVDVPSVTKADSEASVVEIETKEEFQSYINNGTFVRETTTITAKANDNIVLTANLDMKGLVLTNTIGTESSPFTGTFDGRGYSISNLEIELANESKVSEYVGLFGVTDGAVIKNLAIQDSVKLKLGNVITSYVGALVGKAHDTTIQYIQSTAKVDVENMSDKNINLGGIVGLASDCQISYVICRNSKSFGKWTFDGVDGNVLTLGGLAGVVSNSQVSFAIIGENFDVTVSADFVGDISLGGIAGKVVQGGSKLINIACENSILLKNDALDSVDPTIYVGDIAGVVANPSPESKNISYIHYTSNAGVSLFGSQGGYVFSNESSYDYITVATESMNTSSYFANQIWHPLYSEWDFDGVWYVGSSVIYLQSFYGDLEVKVSQSLNTEILTYTTLSQTNYRFGDRVEIDFQFATGMSKYYSLSTINLDGSEKAKIITMKIGEEESYRISGTDDLEIEKNDDGFKLTIKSVNKSNSGEYNITTTAKTFNMEFYSSLYESDNEYELIAGDVPGYVYHAGATATTTENLKLPLVYGTTYRIETKAKNNTPNSFVAWYKVVGEQDSTENNERDDIKLSENTSGILEFTFGKDGYDSDCKIYAKYKDNACNITFKLDDGIIKIDLYSGSVSVTKTGETRAVSKGESSLKLEIYVKKGYKFDPDDFVANLDYKSDDPTKVFCNLQDSYENEDYQYFLFMFDMTILNKGDFVNSFSISANTTKEENNDLTWVWITVGSVGGALVLGIIIFLIVHFFRRNKFGGGNSAGTSFKKKNYKNMYY